MAKHQPEITGLLSSVQTSFLVVPHYVRQPLSGYSRSLMIVTEVGFVPAG
jgi:hypothetical protein